MTEFLLLLFLPSSSSSRPKADCDGYLKMNPAGTVRPSVSCHNFVEEDIYVEPDQNIKNSQEGGLDKSHTLPSVISRQAVKSPSHQKPPEVRDSLSDVGET